MCCWECWTECNNNARKSHNDSSASQVPQEQESSTARRAVKRAVAQKTNQINTTVQVS